MLLTQEAIDELKAIYRKHYGEDLPDDEAQEMGNRLLRVFAVLTRGPAENPNESRGSNAFRFDCR